MNDVMEPPEEPGRPLPSTATGMPASRRTDTPKVDLQAFSSFYRTEVTPLINFLLWMGAGVTDAADIAQETMIEAYRNWPSIQHPRAWIRRVASRQHARRRFDHQPITELDEHRNPLLRAPADVNTWEQRQAVLQLLATLPWRQRQVMAWTFDGYSPQEIAVELSITSQAVRASLKLARRTLAEHLGRAGDTE